MRHTAWNLLDCELEREIGSSDFDGFEIHHSSGTA